jgi:hypothetical protein
MKKTLSLLALLAIFACFVAQVWTQQRPAKAPPSTNWIAIENQTLDAIVKNLAPKVRNAESADQNWMQQEDREMRTSVDSANAVWRQKLFTLRAQLQNAQYQQFMAEADQYRLSTELGIKRDSLKQLTTVLQDLEVTSLKLKELWNHAEGDLNLVYSQYHDYYLLSVSAQIPDRVQLSDRQIADDMRPYVFYYAKQTGIKNLNNAVRKLTGNPPFNSKSIIVRAISVPRVWWGRVDTTCVNVIFTVAVAPTFTEVADRDDKPPKAADWITQAAVQLVYPDEEILIKGVRPNLEGAPATEAEKNRIERQKVEEAKIRENILSPLKTYIDRLLKISDRSVWDEKIRGCEATVRSAKTHYEAICDTLKTLRQVHKSLSEATTDRVDQSVKTNNALIAANDSLKQAETNWEASFGNCLVTYYPDHVREMTFESSFSSSSQQSYDRPLRELYNKAVASCRDYFFDSIAEYVEAESLRAVPGLDRKANAWEKPSQARIVYTSTLDKKKPVIALALAVKYLIPEQRIFKINFIPRNVLRQKAIIDGAGDAVMVTYKNLTYRTLNIGKHGEGLKGVEEMIRKANADGLGNRQNWRLPGPSELEAIHYYAESSDDKQPYTLFEELGILKGRKYWTEKEVGNSFDRKFITVEFGKKAYEIARPSSSSAHCIMVSQKANAEVKK